MSTGLWAAVSAVIVDSIVTLYVGWRLNRTARQETAKAADTVKPVLKAEMEKAALVLIPLVISELQKLLEVRGNNQDGTVRAIHPVSNEPATYTG